MFSSVTTYYLAALLEDNVIRNYLPEMLLVAALVTGMFAMSLSYSDYPSPLQQVRDDGVSPEDVQCNAGLVHTIRANGAHVCVREITAERFEWEIFVAEEVVSAGGTATQKGADGYGTAHNVSSSVEFVNDGREVEVTVPPKPAQALAEDEALSTAAVKDDSSADGSLGAQLHDPRYVADDKIMLQGVENKLPNLTGVWMPITKEEAEHVVMPRLAAALGDKLILPEITDYEFCLRIPLPDCPRFLDESDPYNLKYYPYDTEMGNTFSAWKTFGNPDIISTIKYRIYERVQYEEREEFFRSFMEKAGFYGAKVHIGDINGIIYGNLLSVDLEFLADQKGPFMQLIFRGWTNEYVDDRIPEGLLLSNEDVKRRAHAFAAAHVDLWDKEKCSLGLKDVEAVDIYYLAVIAGVPIKYADVGNCYNPDNPGSGPRSQSVLVEATEGEIIWPVDKYYIVNDWINRIDIPESAKVNHNNYDKNN